MPCYEYACRDCGRVTVLLAAVGAAPASTLCACDADAPRRYSVPAVTFDGGRQRWGETTLAAERAKAETELSRFIDRPGSKWHRDHFRFKKPAYRKRKTGDG